jgi:hypothetical protein
VKILLQKALVENKLNDFIENLDKNGRELGYFELMNNFLAYEILHTSLVSIECLQNILNLYEKGVLDYDLKHLNLAHMVFFEYLLLSKRDFKYVNLFNKKGFLVNIFMKLELHTSLIAEDFFKDKFISYVNVEKVMQLMYYILNIKEVGLNYKKF